MQALISNSSLSLSVTKYVKLNMSRLKLEITNSSPFLPRQIQIPSKVRGWNPQLMNGRLLTSTTTTEEPPAVLEADNCEFLDLLKDAKIAI
jgi:hypothetical protein